MLPIPRAGRWGAADFPSLYPGPSVTTAASPLSPSPYHPCAAGIPSFRPQLQPYRGLREVPGRMGLRPPGSAVPPTALCSAIPRQTRGNAGSYIILMRDDAWRVYVLWQHQGSWGAGRGSSGSWSLPPPGFLSPPGTTEHSGSPPCYQAQCGLTHPSPVQASVYPPVPLGAGSPCNPGIPLYAPGQVGVAATLTSGPWGWCQRWTPSAHFLGTLASCPAVATSIARATKGSSSLRCLGMRGHPRWAMSGRLPGLGVGELWEETAQGG